MKPFVSVVALYVGPIEKRAKRLSAAFFFCLRLINKKAMRPPATIMTIATMAPIALPDRPPLLPSMLAAADADGLLVAEVADVEAMEEKPLLLVLLLTTLVLETDDEEGFALLAEDDDAGVDVCSGNAVRV